MLRINLLSSFRPDPPHPHLLPPLCPTAHTTSQAEFEDTLRINLLSSFGVLRAAAKAMMRPANGGGSIVFCSSAVAKHGIPNHEAIAAAKVRCRGYRCCPSCSFRAPLAA